MNSTIIELSVHAWHFVLKELHREETGACYGIIQPTEKYQKLSLKSTNLINYTSSDNYNLGATLAQYNLTTNYLEPIINLQSPLTQTHTVDTAITKRPGATWNDLTSKYSSPNCYSSPSIASPINLSRNNNN